MQSLMKYKVKKYVPKYCWNKVAGLMVARRKKQFEELNFSFGIKNMDKAILIIRRRPPGGGLFSNINHVLQGIIYASENNMVPVVDMKNYSTEYSIFRKFLGTNNAWEYFFEPVSEITLEDAYNSYNVTLSKGDRLIREGDMAGRNLNFVFDLKSIKTLNNIYDEHIKLNSFTLSYINYLIKSFEIDNIHTLGVFLRGKDYISSPTSGHPKQPRTEEVIRDVEKYVEEKEISKIFLSTDDVIIRNLFENRFTNLVCPSTRIDSESNFSISTRKAFKIPKGPLAKNFSYLSEIYILSKLDFNIASLSNGSAILHVINGGKFKDSKLYNLGVN